MKYYYNRSFQTKVVIIASILLLLFLPVICWVLIGTITFTLDTDTNDYSLRLFGLFSLRVLSLDKNITARVSAPFYQKTIDIEKGILESLNGEKGPRAKRGQPKKQTNPRYLSQQLKKNWWRILKTFKVRKFRLNVDTDNFLANSMLFPAVYFAQKKGYNVGINYLGRQEISLILKNRLGNILLALLKP